MLAQEHLGVQHTHTHLLFNLGRLLDPWPTVTLASGRPFHLPCAFQGPSLPPTPASML